MVIGNRKCLMITSKRLNTKLDHLPLKHTVQGAAVEQVGAQKLLGVILDQSLNFNEHVEQLCKLSQKIVVLRKSRRYLPIGECILYYNAIIKQTLPDGSTVWTSCLQRISTKCSNFKSKLHE